MEVLNPLKMPATTLSNDSAAAMASDEMDIDLDIDMDPVGEGAALHSVSLLHFATLQPSVLTLHVGC